MHKDLRRLFCYKKDRPLPKGGCRGNHLSARGDKGYRRTRRECLTAKIFKLKLGIGANVVAPQRG